MTIPKGGKLRSGFTTGSCAAAAAGAACRMLFTGRVVTQLTIMTPKGIPFPAEIVDIERSENTVTCGVIKDGGDDPDVTTGLHILARAEFLPWPTGKRRTAALEKGEGKKFKTGKAWQDPGSSGRDSGGTESLPEPAGSAGDASVTAESAAAMQEGESLILIDGGPGVGRVTKPGLDQPVGEAAINHVPRQMIREQVETAMRVCDVHEGVRITILVPGGAKRAQKTFNPRLGIEGGISILGTSGIVEPMSEQALRDTIRVELAQKRALGWKTAAVSPGNYGLEFMKRTYGYDLDQSVKCSNFIGDTIDMAAELGFENLLLTGHIGKLIKVSGGIMNTHSHEGDCRMELLAAAALRSGADADTARKILAAVTTTEGVRILREAGGELLQHTMDSIMTRIMYYLDRRADGRIHIECMMYTNEDGLLARSHGAEEMLCRLMNKAGTL